MKKFMLMMLLVSFIIPQLSMQEASALSCASRMSIEEAYDYYSGIVVAKVDKLVERSEYNELQITVSKSYKGVTESKIILAENKTWGAINGPSIVGEEYLFFLKEHGVGWENPLCSPSEKTSTMSKELEFLKDKEMEIDNISSESDITHDIASNKETDVIKSSPIKPHDRESFIKSNTYKVIIGLAIVAVVGVVLWAIMPQRKR